MNLILVIYFIFSIMIFINLRKLKIFEFENLLLQEVTFIKYKNDLKLREFQGRHLVKLRIQKYGFFTS